MTESVAIPTPPPKSTWPVLAGVRFLLAMCVMIGHSYMVYPLTDEQLILKVGGIPAVLGFFIISGYSIAHSIYDAPQGYLKRRFLRIMPLYYASIIFALLPVVFYGYSILLTSERIISMPQQTDILWLLIFMQGGAIVTPLLLSPLWSISCEMLYYCMAPWLRRKESLLILAIGVVSLAQYFILTVHMEVILAFTDMFIAPLALAWAWLGGFLYYRNPKSKVTLGLLWLGAAFTFHLTFALALVLVLNAHRIKLSPRMQRVMVYLGDISYPLYLVHWSMMILIGGSDYARNAGWLVVPGAWVASIALSSFLYHIVDKPFRSCFRNSMNKPDYKKLLKPALLLFAVAPLLMGLAEPRTLKILPLGDSITFGEVKGENYESGYRKPLEAMLLEATGGSKAAQLKNGKHLPAIKIVGTQEDPYHRHHDGYSGWRLDNIDSIIERIMPATKPDIILMHLGTNDVYQGTDDATLEKRADQLLSHIHKLAPKSIVLVATIIPMCSGKMVLGGQDKRVAPYNAILKKVIEKHIAQGETLRLVDMYEKADMKCEDMPDGAHPGAVGYRKMAVTWRNALMEIIPQFGY